MYAVDGQVNTTYTYFPQTDVLSQRGNEGTQDWTQVADKQTQLSAKRSIDDGPDLHMGHSGPYFRTESVRSQCSLGRRHINFCNTRAAFNTTLWGGTGANPTSETPGDNAAKWRTIVSFLRP